MAGPGTTSCMVEIGLYSMAAGGDDTLIYGYEFPYSTGQGNWLTIDGGTGTDTLELREVDSYEAPAGAVKNS